MTVMTRRIVRVVQVSFRVTSVNEKTTRLKSESTELLRRLTSVLLFFTGSSSHITNIGFAIIGTMTERLVQIARAQNPRASRSATS